MSARAEARPRPIRPPRAVLGLAILLSAPVSSAPLARERVALRTTPHFAFYSDFETNLNDALIAAGLARTKTQPELFRSGAEAGCFDGLPPSARAGWGGAVDYYAKIVSPADWTAREQYLIRVQLAGFDDELKDPKDRQFVEITAGLRAAAAPAYEACRWPAQDAKNRRWIEDLQPRLAAHEQTIAARLEQLYRKRWGGLPIPVDVVEIVNWSGANSILRDTAPGGHLLIANSYQGPAALETVFHEASHLLTGRDAPLRKALESAAGETGVRLPGDLWHVVLFYTTGEVVRGILADGGAAGYTPMLYGIFDRGDWTDYRKPLETAWRPYVDGERNLPEAAASLMAALPKPAQPSGGHRR